MIRRAPGAAFLIVAMTAIGSSSALAFDPHTWARDYDPNISDSSYCITEAGDYNWNNEAVERVVDARQKWETIPGFNMNVDTTPADCPWGDSRVEMAWINCWALDDNVLGITVWSFAGLDWTGTQRILFFKKAGCGGNDRAFAFNPPSEQSLKDHVPQQYDFMSLAEHEMGHAYGMHHPEAAQIVNVYPGGAVYPWASFDAGQDPVMQQQLPVGEYERILQQDDFSGGAWADSRRILARPNQVDFWGTYQGNVQSESGYLILTKDPGVPDDDYSYMYMTTRFSTDGRAPRQTPTLTVKWRKTSGQSQGNGDRLRLRIAWRPVYSYAQGGGFGSFAYTYADPCYDTHSGDNWETCTWTFDAGDQTVQDIRAYIYNSTVGRVQLQDIDFQDGTA